MQEEVDFLEACKHAGFEHQMGWDLEDIELVIWSCFNVELKGVKVCWLTSSFRRGIHSKEPVFLWLCYPRKISDKQESVLFHLLAALRNYLLEHVEVVDECGDGVRKDDTINFLR